LELLHDDAYQQQIFSLSGILATHPFLFDKSQTPHMRADELCPHFGLSPKTGSAKSTAIMELLKIGPMDPNCTLPS
jgi:hypothetical protein